MIGHEKTQHQPNTDVTDQAHKNRLITTLRQLGTKSLTFAKHTKHTLHTAQLIHRHGFPLPSYEKEESATPREIDSEK